MKITIYELLGLVKDGKAPKKIKCDDKTYEYDEDDEFYYCDGVSLYRELVPNGNCLDYEVEIIEEDKKIKYCKGYEEFLSVDEYIEHLGKKIDELIDEINNLKKEK